MAQFSGELTGQDGKTYASQTVNPNQTTKIDNLYETGKGVAMLHETLESYNGAVNSPGTNGNISMEDIQQGTKDAQSYLNAHNAVMVIDPRYKEPNISANPNGENGIYMSKFPVNLGIPPSLNPEIIINTLKR